MVNEITLINPETVTLINWLMEAGRRLDKAEPNFAETFLVLAPGSRLISFLPADMMRLLLSNYAMAQGAVEERISYLEQLNEEIRIAEVHRKRATGEPDTSVN